MRKEPSASVIRAWCDAVDENGQRLITLRQLLKAFGYQRRSSASLTSISRYLEEKGLYVDVPDGIDIDASVPLTAEPVRRIGELYEREADLERRFPGGIMRRVGLERVVSRQYSPRGTRDKLDFLCLDNDGRSVVVELKAGPGDKRAVEQVLRYIGVLKKEGGHKEPRGVLITGVGDLHTRRALEGRQADDHIRWWVYGLRGSRILLEEIDTRPAPSPRVAASDTPSTQTRTRPRPVRHRAGRAR